jgi:hypothetical protein
MVVGGSEYESLSEALTAVTDGQTIKLLDDISYNNSIATAGKSFTIDLNGYTLNVSTTADNSISATNGKTLTFSGSGELNVNVNTLSTYSGLYASGSDSKVIVGSSVITAVTASGNADYGVIADSGGRVTMTGSVTVPNNASNLGVYTAGPGSVADISGPVSGGWAAVYTSNGGTASVTGNVTNTLVNGYGVYANNATVAVTGDISATGGGNYGVFAENSGVVTVTGDITSHSVGVSVYNVSTITIDGEIAAYGGYVQMGSYGNYVNEGGYITPTTKAGYLTYSDSDSTVWIKFIYQYWTDGITDTNQYPFGGGNGTSQVQAYEISTPEQLAQLAYNVNAGSDYSNKYFKLTADIDLLGKEWTPIGYRFYPGAERGFNGIFDGNNKTISKYVYRSFRRTKKQAVKDTSRFIRATKYDAVLKDILIEATIIYRFRYKCRCFSRLQRIK